MTASGQKRGHTGKGRPHEITSYAAEGLFARFDSAAGANFCARTTFDACIGIDVIDFAFRDCFNGANGETCTASHTSVSDNVSHNSKI